MGEATTCLSKGKIIAAIDSYLNQNFADKRQKLLDATNIFDLGLPPTIVSERDRDHCEEVFLGEGARAWWPRVTGKREKLRAVYLEALRECIENGKKRIVTYWVRCLPGEKFETCFATTPDEVHVFWLTSGMHGMRETAPAGVDHFSQELFMVGEAGEIQAEWDKFPDAAPWNEEYEGPVELTNSPGMKRLEIPGY